MAPTEEPFRSATPYSTGGGGVVLEHAFAATMLEALLTHRPIAGLDPAFAAANVAFQAGHVSPVDDLVITGRSTDGSEQTIALAVRRNPTIAASDADFVKLAADMLALCGTRATEIATRTLRIGLVVAGPHSGAAELGTLTDLARRHNTLASFESGVARERGRLRQRHGWFRSVVQAALQALRQDPALAAERTWQLMSALRVIVCDLEGDSAQDVLACVARLDALTEPPGNGARVWSELYRLTASYAPAGATIDDGLLRRELLGRVSIGRSPRFGQAWRYLDALAAEFRTVRQRLQQGEDILHLDRASATAAVHNAIQPGRHVIVTGAPDTGKSAVVVRVADQLEADAAALVAVNLRDLPAATAELVHLIGDPLEDVLGGMPVASLRCVIVDGAEAVLEGRAATMRALVHAASSCGAALVAVARSDAADAVERVFSDAEPAGARAAERIEVGPLTTSEVAEVVERFPGLQPIAREARASWILSRLGLVDLLLRAEAVTSLPAGPIAESDILVAVWADFVRNGEQPALNGAQPDSREQVLLGMARQRLLSGTPYHAADAVALQSLRSDELLRRERPTAGDDFANDLVRDFAVAVLLEREGLGPLQRADAPRWALRAATLACQSLLLASRAPEGTRRQLEAEFSRLAATYGARWADVVTEALLTPKLADAALSEAWQSLLADDGRELRRVVRVLLDRHASGGALDPLAGRPLVALIIGRYEQLLGLPVAVTAEVGRVIDAWLGGMVTGDDVPDETRQALRELLIRGPLLDHDSWRHIEQHLERLASLGADVDEQVIAQLRAVASDHPNQLVRALEGPFARWSLARHRAALLLELAETYYIEPEQTGDEEDDLRWSSVHDEGIRDHMHLGWRAPMAAPYRGPFRELLWVAPREAIALINRLLNRAARVRVATLRNLEHNERDRALDLAVCGAPSRRYVGDSHVWGWYRGGTVGPYPAMSALMALEDWADQMLRGVMPIDVLCALLLDGAESLAMPGLVYGLLLRHLEQAGDMLDGFLVSPAVWVLEFGRVTNESGFLVRRDPEQKSGRERRPSSPRDVAAEMTMRARLAGDSARLEALGRIADALDVAATTAGNSPEMRSWAAAFRWQNYEASAAEEGLSITFAPPSDIEAAMSQTRADLARGGTGYRLLQAYAGDNDEGESPTSEQLVQDLRVARAYDEDPPEAGPRDALEPPAAVAAAALVAHGAGAVELALTDVDWAIQLLARAAPDVDGAAPGDPSRFSWGSDRSAARGLTALLLPRFGRDRAQPTSPAFDDAVGQMLRRLAASRTDEVRRVLAQSLDPVWRSSCGPVLQEDVACRHNIALSVAVEGLRWAPLGGYDDRGYRPAAPMADIDVAALKAVEPGDLVLDWLTAPLIAATGGYRSGSCVAQRAKGLVMDILEIHLAALPHYLEHHYRREDFDREPVATALLVLAGAGDTRILDDYLVTLRAHPEGLGELLEDMARVATYDPAVRGDLRAVWPHVMESVLAAAEAGVQLRGDSYLDDTPLAAAVAVPTPRPADRDIDGRIRSAAGGWVAIPDVSAQLTRWLPLASGSAHCADAIVAFLRAQDSAAQVDPGLSWAADIVEGDAESVANGSYLMNEWLEQLRAEGVITREHRPQYQRLVDVLAAAGDARARRLQAAEE